MGKSPEITREDAKKLDGKLSTNGIPIKDRKPFNELVEGILKIKQKPKKKT